MAAKKRPKPLPAKEHKARVWIIGVAAAVAATLVGTFVIAVVPQIFDVRKLGDDVRTGDALSITLLGEKNTSGGWQAVFPRADANAAQQFMVPGPFPQDVHDYLRRELDAGAFLLGGANLQVEVEGRRNEEITLYDVRPVVTREQLPTGPVTAIGSQGNDTLQMTFNLDSPQPIATISDGSPQDGDAYFDDRRIGFTDGHKETLSLSLHAYTGAYSLAIAFDYEISGVKYTQMLRRATGPFRVAAALCVAQADRAKVPADVQRTFAGMSYQSAVGVDFGSAYKIVPMDPKKVCIGH